MPPCSSTRSCARRRPWRRRARGRPRPRRSRPASGDRDRTRSALPSRSSPARSRGSASAGRRCATCRLPRRLLPTLELLEVDAALRRVGALAGPGSQAARKRELAACSRAPPSPSSASSSSLLLGELRQGALEGVMVDAVAKAADVPAADVRRALMLAGELPAVAAAALADGRDGPRVVPAGGAPPRQADARADRRPDRRGARARRARPPSSGSSTARGSRCTGSARRCARSRATSPTSPTACRRSSRPSARCRSTAARARRRGDRAAPRRPSAAVPGDDEPVRHERRRDGSRERVPLSPFFFDCLHVDGDDLLDRPASRAARAARCARAGAEPRPAPRDRAMRPRRSASSRTRSRAATRASW